MCTGACASHTTRSWYVRCLTQGEHFRCHWDVAPLTVNAQGEHRPSEALNAQQPLALKLPGQGATASSGRRRVIYLTEQVSHHPPISSYYYDCPEAGLTMVGVDQVSAKFTGTAVRIYPGKFNQGMFITLGPNVRAQNAVGEEYHITHPAGAIFGLFRGSFWPAVTDTATITCTPPRGSQTYLRAIIEYKEESWLSKPKYAVEGCIYTYEPGQPSASYSALKEVSPKNVVIQLQGTWRGVITWKRKGEKTAHPLVNLADLQPCPRDVRPIDAQDAWESRRIWKDVTDAIVGQQYSRATQLKQQVEQRQREIAAERKKTGAEFVPRFFEDDIASGRPRLTDEGRAAVEEERRRPAGAAGAARPAPAKDEDEFEDAPSF